MQLQLRSVLSPVYSGMLPRTSKVCSAVLADVHKLQRTHAPYGCILWIMHTLAASHMLSNTDLLL
jgi:hypothetical protein